MREFSGIDLHSNNAVVIVSDETNQVVYEKRHANDLAGILAALEPYRAELVGVVVESTHNWYWLVDGLMEAGYEVRLANAAVMRSLQQQIEKIEKRLRGRVQLSCRLCATQVGSRHRPGAGHHDHAGDGHREQICDGG